MFLASLLIQPAYQRRGIGSAVLREILRAADTDGRPVSWTVLNNNPARRLYERHGFCFTGEDDVRYCMIRKNAPSGSGPDSCLDPGQS